jgi:hypothetical protein
MIINFINQYSTLILAIITGIYVYFTWRMVREMKEARQVDQDSQLIAEFIPFGLMYINLRIENIGPGPAYNIKSKMYFFPISDLKTEIWNQPVMLPNSFADFRPPGNEMELEKLKEKYQSFIVDLEWENSFHKVKYNHIEIDLDALMAGWSDAKWLIPPEPIHKQLNSIRDEIKKIAENIKGLK